MRVLVFLMMIGSGCIRGEETARDAAVAETTATSETSATDTTTAPDTTSACNENLVCDAPRENRLNCASDCFCQNGSCDVGETRATCPDDCGCGNGTCETEVESNVTCPADCCPNVTCGDCDCNYACGESLQNCPKDCGVDGDGIVSPGETECGKKLDACRCVIDHVATGDGGCGDGCCIGYLCGETPTNCSLDCGTACGNGTCDPGETPYTCEEDCQRKACGNGTCEGPDEDSDNCEQDCGNTCGNCQCEANESYITCPPDCGFCGDGVCSNCPLLDEIGHCALDCE